MRILVVEDERGLNRVLTKHLKNNGYSVDSCENGREAIEYLDLAAYDLVLLDVMLPGMSGWDILHYIREKNMDTSVLMLTALDSIEDKVKGLDGGADDYLTKPFALEELLARIRLATRKQRGSRNNIYTLADLSVDCHRRMVSRGGKEIILSAKEFSMLEYLIANKGIVLSREKILNHLWDYDYEGSSNMIDVYIRHLRKKIDQSHDVKLIHTVRGVGYVMREPS